MMIFGLEKPPSREGEAQLDERMKRYNIYPLELSESAEGEWVLYADIERDLKELAVLRASLGRQPIDDNDDMRFG